MSTGRLVGLAAAIVAAMTLVAFSYVRFGSDSPVPHDTVRAPGDAGNPPSSSMLSADQLIEFWRARVDRDPRDYISLTELGGAFLRRARETGDVASYSGAEAALKSALALNPDYAGALAYEASLRQVRHDFRGALEIAERIYAVDPQAAHALAVSGDANLELGDYDAAEFAYMKLLDLSDSPPVGSRLAHLRELQGRPGEAIDLMADAAARADEEETTAESRAWYRSQLARLYFNTGDLNAAAEQYKESLDAFPGYIHALAGLARIAAAEQDYDRAIELYSSVVERQPVLEHVVALGDVYQAAGRAEDAQRQYDLVAAIDSLYRANGINTDIEMALFLADHDLRLDRAVAEAFAIYEKQSGNIRAADALSWALYKAGRSDQAAPYSREAVRLGTRDPLILFHAGMISRAVGDDAGAREYLSRLADTNPRFSVLHADEATSVLAELNGAVTHAQ